MESEAEYIWDFPGPGVSRCKELKKPNHTQHVMRTAGIPRMDVTRTKKKVIGSKMHCLHFTHCQILPLLSESWFSFARHKATWTRWRGLGFDSFPASKTWNRWHYLTSDDAPLVSFQICYELVDVWMCEFAKKGAAFRSQSETLKQVTIASGL